MQPLEVKKSNFRTPKNSDTPMPGDGDRFLILKAGWNTKKLDDRPGWFNLRTLLKRAGALYIYICSLQCNDKATVSGPKNGKTLLTGLGSSFCIEPRGVTDTPGYSAAVSAIGGPKIRALEGKH